MENNNTATLSRTYTDEDQFDVDLDIDINDDSFLLDDDEIEILPGLDEQYDETFDQAADNAFIESDDSNTNDFLKSAANPESIAVDLSTPNKSPDVSFDEDLDLDIDIEGDLDIGLSADSNLEADRGLGSQEMNENHSDRDMLSDKPLSVNNRNQDIGNLDNVDQGSDIDDFILTEEDLLPVDFDENQSAGKVPAMLSFEPHEDYLIRKIPDNFVSESPETAKSEKTQQATLDDDEDSLFLPVESVGLDSSLAKESREKISEAVQLEPDLKTDREQITEDLSLPEHFSLINNEELVIIDISPDAAKLKEDDSSTDGVLPLANKEDNEIEENEIEENPGSHDEQTIAEESKGGFFDEEDDDDTIALSHDELNEVLEDVEVIEEIDQEVQDDPELPVEDLLDQRDIELEPEIVPETLGIDDEAKDSDLEDQKDLENQSGGFFDEEDDDDTIALSDDELNEVLEDVEEVEENLDQYDDRSDLAMMGDMLEIEEDVLSTDPPEVLSQTEQQKKSGVDQALVETLALDADVLPILDDEPTQKNESKFVDDKSDHELVIIDEELPAEGSSDTDQESIPTSFKESEESDVFSDHSTSSQDDDDNLTLDMESLDMDITDSESDFNEADHAFNDDLKALDDGDGQNQDDMFSDFDSEKGVGTLLVDDESTTLDMDDLDLDLDLNENIETKSLSVDVKDEDEDEIILETIDEKASLQQEIDDSLFDKSAIDEQDEYDQDENLSLDMDSLDMDISDEPIDGQSAQEDDNELADEISDKDNDLDSLDDLDGIEDLGIIDDVSDLEEIVELEDETPSLSQQQSDDDSEDLDFLDMSSPAPDEADRGDNEDATQADAKDEFDAEDLSLDMDSLDVDLRDEDDQENNNSEDDLEDQVAIHTSLSDSSPLEEIGQSGQNDLPFTQKTSNQEKIDAIETDSEKLDFFDEDTSIQDELDFSDDDLDHHLKDDFEDDNLSLDMDSLDMDISEETADNLAPESSSDDDDLDAALDFDDSKAADRLEEFALDDELEGLDDLESTDVLEEDEELGADVTLDDNKDLSTQSRDLEDDLDFTASDDALEDPEAMAFDDLVEDGTDELDFEQETEGYDIEGDNEDLSENLSLDMESLDVEISDKESLGFEDPASDDFDLDESLDLETEEAADPDDLQVLDNVDMAAFDQDEEPYSKDSELSSTSQLDGITEITEESSLVFAGEIKDDGHDLTADNPDNAHIKVKEAQTAKKAQQSENLVPLQLLDELLILFESEDDLLASAMAKQQKFLGKAKPKDIGQDEKRQQNLLDEIAPSSKSSNERQRLQGGELPTDGKLDLPEQDFSKDKDQDALNLIEDEEKQLMEQESGDQFTKPFSDHEALLGSMAMPSREELKKVISYLDGLFENLPDEAVKKFAKSEYFDLYINILSKLEIN